jgi:hypothetical protein
MSKTGWETAKLFNKVSCNIIMKDDTVAIIFN